MKGVVILAGGAGLDMLLPLRGVGDVSVEGLGAARAATRTFASGDVDFRGTGFSSFDGFAFGDQLIPDGFILRGHYLYLLLLGTAILKDPSALPGSLGTEVLKSSLIGIEYIVL